MVLTSIPVSALCIREVRWAGREEIREAAGGRAYSAWGRPQKALSARRSSRRLLGASDAAVRNRLGELFTLEFVDCPGWSGFFPLLQTAVSGSRPVPRTDRLRRPLTTAIGAPSEEGVQVITYLVTNAAGSASELDQGRLAVRAWSLRERANDYRSSASAVSFRNDCERVGGLVSP